jgi:hypothetical protein
MNAKPMLGDWEIPRIASIRMLERRAFAELPVPGKSGSLLQDLASEPARMAIAGSLYGDEARNDFLDEVRTKFSAGEAVTFVADIVHATEIQYVVIDELRIEESGERPDLLDYRFVLRESPPPPPPPDPLGGLDAGLLDQAGGLLDTVTGALDALAALGDAPDLGNPTEPLTGLLDEVSSATSALPGLLDDLSNLLGSPA